MKIRFCGAARSVTGSCHMISANGKNVLVDCGMRQGADKKTELGEDKFPFNPAEIDAVLLTHAHIDHSGLIPLLVKQGFKGSIIATDATAQLSGIKQCLTCCRVTRNIDRGKRNEPLLVSQGHMLNTAVC